MVNCHCCHTSVALLLSACCECCWRSAKVLRMSVVCCNLFECSVSVVFEVDAHDWVLDSGACSDYYYVPSALLRAEYRTAHKVHTTV